MINLMKNPTRYMMISLITLILMIVLGHGVLDLFTVGRTDHINLNDSTEVYIREDGGGLKKTDMDNIPSMNHGDEITFIVSLSDARNELETPALCFYQYHSEITVTLGGVEIYKRGQDETAHGWMYGDEYCIVPLTKSSMGQKVVINVKQMEGYASDHYTEFIAMNQEDARWYPLMHHQMDFMVYLMVFVISFMVLICSLVGVCLTGPAAVPSFFMAFFCVLASAWHLAYRRMFYIMVGDDHLSAVLEYPLMLAMPIPLFLFLASMTMEKIGKITYYVIGILFTILFAVATVMDHVADYHYPMFEQQMYLLGIIAIILTLVTEVRNLKRQEADRSRKILRRGIIITLALAMMQVVFVILRVILPMNPLAPLFHLVDFTAVALLFFMLSLGSCLYVKFTDVLKKQVAKEQLRKLAYVDMLTGIPNRAACAEQLEAMDAKPQEYGIIFFDADGLKYANDTYGHKLGDQLICDAAWCIRDAFNDCQGFFGRWGGDEFLAVFTCPKEMDDFTERFRHQIRQVNATGNYPFEFTISYGSAVNDPKDSMTVNQIRDMADDRMYEFKKLHKKQRGLA